MQRYFTELNQWKEDYVTIVQDDFHHIKNVMRMNVSDYIYCVHPNGTVAKCMICEINNKEVITKVIEWLDENKELPVRVTIIQGLPKKNKLEFILQKGTELGCSDFYLFEANRSIVQWNEKKRQQKLVRYEKIVKEASEQCHRHYIPTVSNISSLETLLLDQEQLFDVIVFAYEEEAKQRHYSSFSSVLKKLKPGQHIGICIGPEGGFSEDEVQFLRKYDAKPVRLGPRILRTETASLYALASISYHFEELEC